MQTREMTAQEMDDNSAAGVNAELILAELTYHRAAELARAGRYSQAEVILQQIDKNRDLRPLILDLRAKMFAQQGRYIEAYACWTEALSISPGNTEYSEAIEALRARALYRPWIRPARMVAATLVFVLVVVGAFVLGQRTRTDSFKAENSRAAITESVRESRPKQETPANVPVGNPAGEQQAVSLRLENVSKQLDTLTAKNDEIKQTIKLQSGTIDDLKSQLNGVRTDMSASADSMSKRLDSLDKQDAETQKILKEQTHKDEGLLAGVAKILWAPFDFVLNIGKPRTKLKVDSSEHGKLPDNQKTGPGNRGK
jgi:tetratricopeptide (TPR) repeat protein